MPIFDAVEDPGSNFPELLRRVGLGTSAVAAGGELTVPHATTCVALTYSDGVVMAGDRRATAGNLISHRSMEKVVQADHYSGVAIAGAAGPAMEMIRLFQLQLEHYEKVEGSFLSLEGKANQLSMMVRSNLPAAMQGMVVVPLFAGFDVRRDVGRLFAYDVTGGRYEERDYIATGSGSLHAGTVIKVGFRTDMSRDDAILLACRALWEAADADSATGGPDLLRGIYPTVATVTAAGWERVSDDELASRYETIASRGALDDEHAVLRRPRAGDEGPCRLRPQGHRQGPGAGRRALRRRDRHRGREPVRDAPQDQRDLRPHRVRRRREVQRVRSTPRRRGTGGRPEGLPVLAATTSTRGASPTSTRRSSARSSPTR